MASTVEEANASQWTLLPNDILHLITNKIANVADFVRFAAVCKEWLLFCHSSYKEKHHLHNNQQLPLLVIPTQDQERRGLYNIIKGTIFDQIQLHLPTKRCCGSSHGWLFFQEKKSRLEVQLILINPFLSNQGKFTIKLPPIKFIGQDRVQDMDEDGVVKAILSKDPFISPDDYEVMAIYGGLRKLAHYKAGDNFWSYPINEELKGFLDVIFHKGAIYAVGYYKWFIRVSLKRFKRTRGSDCSSCYLQFVTIMKRLTRRSRSYAGNEYLVEDSKGNLLLVRRYYWTMEELLAQDAANEELQRRLAVEYQGRVQERGHQVVEYQEDEETDEEEESSSSDDEIETDDSVYEEMGPNLSVHFRVYKLPLSSERKLLRVKTLLGETFFLGDNHSISVSASKYCGLVPNLIYYTDDNVDVYDQNIYFGSCDTGVFNLKNEEITKYFVPSFSIKGRPPPIFIVPRIKSI